MKLVKLFEETGSLKRRPRSARFALEEGRNTAVEKTTTNLAKKSPSVRKAVRILNVFPSLIRRTVGGIFHRYPYKLQSLQDLQPGDTVMRVSFATWAMARIENDTQ